jgi:hypothetical protein
MPRRREAARVHAKFQIDLPQCSMGVDREVTAFFCIAQSAFVIGVSRGRRAAPVWHPPAPKIRPLPTLDLSPRKIFVIFLKGAESKIFVCEVGRDGNRVPARSAAGSCLPQA